MPSVYDKNEYDDLPGGMHDFDLANLTHTAHNADNYSTATITSRCWPQGGGVRSSTRCVSHTTLIRSA